MTYRCAWIDLTLFLFSLFITLFKAALPRFISVKYFSIVYCYDVFFVNNTSIEWSDSGVQESTETCFLFPLFPLHVVPVDMER